MLRGSMDAWVVTRPPLQPACDAPVAEDVRQTTASPPAQVRRTVLLWARRHAMTGRGMTGITAGLPSLAPLRKGDAR